MGIAAQNPLCPAYAPQSRGYSTVVNLKAEAEKRKPTTIAAKPRVAIQWTDFRRGSISRQSKVVTAMKCRMPN
jgi:hypothetical protein